MHLYFDICLALAIILIVITISRSFLNMQLKLLYNVLSQSLKSKTFIYTYAFEKMFLPTKILVYSTLRIPSCFMHYLNADS